MQTRQGDLQEGLVAPYGKATFQLRNHANRSTIATYIIMIGLFVFFKSLFFCQGKKNTPK